MKELQLLVNQTTDCFEPVKALGLTEISESGILTPPILVSQSLIEATRGLLQSHKR